MLIQGKMLSYGDDLSEVYAIRRKVFVEEQQIPEYVEFDEFDEEAMHVIVYEEAGSKKAVASGRIIYKGNSCEIGRVAVLKEYRCKKYGDFTVRMLLNKAFTAGINTVTLNSQISAVEFYEKIGFHRAGFDFTQAGIIHCPMIINITDINTQCNKDKNLTNSTNCSKKSF
ncbi:MAG: GCN5-related N-acetyltransferase [Lachnospiraceae bacterium]|nr:GCN5-related N-acetyltransferase [Lachnospiraceae bacterium]